jgi:hypothetical protein
MDIGLQFRTQDFQCVLLGIDNVVHLECHSGNYTRRTPRLLNHQMDFEVIFKLIYIIKHTMARY